MEVCDWYLLSHKQCRSAYSDALSNVEWAKYVGKMNGGWHRVLASMTLANIDLVVEGAIDTHVRGVCIAGLVFVPLIEPLLHPFYRHRRQLSQCRATELCISRGKGRSSDRMLRHVSQEV